MSQSFEHLVDIFIAVIIMFLFPLLYFGQKEDTLTQSVISAETDSLVSDIRSKGYLTKEMYDQYLDELSRTDGLYDISIKHRHMVNEPEYRFRTPDEVKEEQDSAYSGSNVLTQLPVSTVPPVVNDPISTGTLNTQTNASILASAVNTPADPSHVHTDACYLGIKHFHTSACYVPHVHDASCYQTTYCDGTWTGVWVDNYSYRLVCPYCGWDSGSTGSTQASPSNAPSPVWFTCKCGKTSQIAWVDNGHAYWTGHCTKCPYGITSYAGSQEGVVHGYKQDLVCNKTTTLVCGKIEGHYYNGNTEVFAVCNQIVSGIVPTNTIQSVALGDPLITTVTATYQDGSTKVVVATANFTADHIVQNQIVTLTYQYTLSGNTYTKTSNITVTVIPRSKTCVNGHTYNLRADGSDPGCPYCLAWLRSLTIVTPASGNITIYKGTTLSENGVTLLATYMDGHTQYLYNEYVDNLDTQYIGTQNVTLSYKGKYVYLNVTSKRNLRLCPVCNRYYELYPDGSDPGCPFCLALTPIFTGNVMNYYNDYETDAILKELYEGSGIYYFSDRDFIEFDIRNHSTSLGRRIINFFDRRIGTDSTQVVDGGYVREEGAPNITVLINPPIQTDIPIVNDPVSTGTLNTQTNASILASAVNTPANPSHVHTDSCYLGSKHVHVGTPSAGGACYGTYTPGGVCGASIVYEGTHNSGTWYWYCPIDATPIYNTPTVTFADYHCLNSNGHHSLGFQTNTYTMTCPTCHRSFTSYAQSIPSSCGATTTGQYSLTCGKMAGHYYSGNTEVFPVCDQLVSSIVSTNPIQTVALSDPLITTVTATYQDGSTKVVIAAANFTADHTVQNQPVNLTYQYTVGETTYTKTCNITVSVIPRSKTCTNGHTYNLRADGSDPSCPYCQAWLRSLSVISPSSGNITICIGTTLPDNGVTLLATYMDGHTQILTNEYIDNLDKQYVGIQNITVSYKGLYVYLTVTTKKK